MANRIRVQMLSKGAAALLKSQDMQDVLLARAEAIAADAGPGFEADVIIGRSRARAMVKSTDWQSMHAQATNNALLKAIGGRAS